MEGRRVDWGGGGWKVDALIKKRLEQLDVKEKLCINYKPKFEKINENSFTFIST